MGENSRSSAARPNFEDKAASLSKRMKKTNVGNGKKLEENNKNGKSKKTQESPPPNRDSEDSDDTTSATQDLPITDEPSTPQPEEDGGDLTNESVNTAPAKINRII